MRFIIYGLFDPREPSHIRYIGRSSSGRKRPISHGSAAHLAADSTYKGNWIRALLREGIMYDFKVLEVVSGLERLNEAEQRWITDGFARGWSLTNLTTGGDGSYTPQSAEYRQRVAEISRQIWATKKHSSATIAKLKALKTGVPRSEETKAKIREACNRPEAIARMREANTGRIFTPEHFARLSAAHKGVMMSDEARAKMSAAHKGKVFSAATREKIAAAKRGKPRPDLAARNRMPEARAQLAALQQSAKGRPRPDVAERNRRRWAQARGETVD